MSDMNLREEIQALSESEELSRADRVILGTDDCLSDAREAELYRRLKSGFEAFESDVRDWAPEIALPTEEDKRSDSEIVLQFVDASRANDLYNKAMALGLESGEIEVVDAEKGRGVEVKIQPIVWVSKPTQMAKLMGLLEEFATEEEMAEVNALIEANPYHTKGHPGAPQGSHGGQFASRADLNKDKGGSYSIRGKKKQKVKITGKGGVKLEFTKQVCGRTAREKGGDVTCWDAKVVRKPGGGKRIVRALGKKKRMEDLAVDLKSILDGDLDELKSLIK